MALNRAERERLIEQYAQGPAKLGEAFAKVPDQVQKWRPGPGRWSAHEIICHCGDAEMNGAMRLRYLLAELDALIVGYDQDNWARVLDYHNLPVQPAFAAVEAARSSTVALLRRLPEEAWTKQGRHTESGSYSVEQWLRIYAEHLEKHTRQIERNLSERRSRPMTARV